MASVRSTTPRPWRMTTSTIIEAPAPTAPTMSITVTSSGIEKPDSSRRSALSAARRRVITSTAPASSSRS